MSDVTARLTAIEDELAGLVAELAADSPGEDMLNAVGLGVKPAELAALRKGVEGKHYDFVWRKAMSTAVSILLTTQVRAAARLIGGYGLRPTRQHVHAPIAISEEEPSGGSPPPDTGPDLLPLLEDG